MGGKAGIRGYIIQTIIALLDSFKNEWTYITIEPDDVSEKVDIKWELNDGMIHVDQIKSSQNVIKLYQAKKWANELELSCPEASVHQLKLIGHCEEKLLKTATIGKTSIPAPKALNIDSLYAEASYKIDAYYETKNKPKISTTVREVLVLSLVTHFANNSITGRRYSRNEFDENLLNWITAIEKQHAVNPYSTLAPVVIEGAKKMKERLAEKINNLVGWQKFSEKLYAEQFNEHLGEFEKFTVDYLGISNSKLKDNVKDIVLVDYIEDLEYLVRPKEAIEQYLYKIQQFLKDYKLKNTPASQSEKREISAFLFWYSLSNTDLEKDFIDELRPFFRKPQLLDSEAIYYILDNRRITFLISSLVSASNYRPEIPVKFLYPITDTNTSPRNLGRRDIEIPPQFVNSSIIPLVKESNEKISVLLYCADSFNRENLKKILWLTIRLTSGFGNEYVIYYSDFSREQQNIANEVIREFSDQSLASKVYVKQFEKVEKEALSNVNLTIGQSQNVNVQPANENSPEKVENVINEAFHKILPYGDLLRPFLNTDAINSSDLKLFLERKGIFIKNADKEKLINVMTSLIFSPEELEDFKSMIDVKKRELKEQQEINTIKSSAPIGEIFRRLQTDLSGVTDGLQTKAIGKLIFNPNPQNPNEYVLDIMTETKKPTEHLSTNTIWGRVRVGFRQEDDNLLINFVASTSKDDRVIASRIAAAVKENLISLDYINQESQKILFSQFKDNQTRVNFLLSFSNIEGSHIFQSQDIQSVKFKFDENQVIPEKYKDKKGKDLVTYFSGKNLAGLNEISEQDFKQILLLEEIKIRYKCDYQNIKGFYYNVKFNFSDAFKNKPSIDGAFRTEPYLFLSDRIKKIGNIEKLKQALATEVDRIKMARYKQFGLI